MKIRWPSLWFGPINLWTAPHQPALEDTMTATAERDEVQEQLCARIDELEAEKEALASQLDRAEEKAGAQAGMHVDAVRHLWESRGYGSCEEMAEHADALAAHVERLHMAWVDAKRCVAVVAFPSLYHVESYQDLAKRSIKKMEAVVSETPETSLAHLKALARDCRRQAGSE